MWWDERTMSILLAGKDVREGLVPLFCSICGNRMGWVDEDTNYKDALYGCEVCAKKIPNIETDVDNFILYWTSDDEERERMRKCLKDYVEVLRND